MFPVSLLPMSSVHTLAQSRRLNPRTPPSGFDPLRHRRPLVRIRLGRYRQSMAMVRILRTPRLAAGLRGIPAGGVAGFWQRLADGLPPPKIKKAFSPEHCIPWLALRPPMPTCLYAL